MARKQGQRTIAGRVYNLGGRCAGVNAKRVAQSEANSKRRAGKLVRIVKVSEFDYLVYEI